jgi:hypothetical protein
MTIQTNDDLINAFNLIQSLNVQKTSGANKIAGAPHSFWRVGPNPVQPAIPTTATTLTDADAGSLSGTLLTTSGKEIRLARLLAIQSANISHVQLYDRLAHMGGLSGVLATSQTVNVSLPGRVPSTGEGVEWYLEWYTDTGSTAVTATITYTNQDGTTGRTTTCALTATMRADRLLRILPNASDTFIQSIQGVQLSATTGTAGNFGVTAMYRIQSIPTPTANVPYEKDYAACCLARIDNEAHLQTVGIASSTSATTVTIEADLIRG